MRSLGEFFGHIAKAVKTDPATKSPNSREVNRNVEEEDRGDVILRRTTIDEIEFKGDADPSDAPRQRDETRDD